MTARCPCLAYLLRALVAVSLLSLVTSGSAWATDELASKIRAAVGAALPQLEAGAVGSTAERQCYTCHSHGLPVMALTAAAARGFEINREVLQQQLEHTWKHLQRGEAAYRDGKGQGGQTMTAGYALWTLETGSWPADSVTAAVAHYLTQRHRDRGHWSGGGQRPPSSGSSFTATYVALRGLSHFGAADQQAEIQERRQAAKSWLMETAPQDTEDRVFYLRALPYVNADEATIQQAVQALLELQAENGGWAQTADMQPDAYATGSVLAALHEVAGLTLEHTSYARGCQYLLDTQLPDGTWHVATRAKPVQDYFESGFPHGDDQFLSIAATGWAALALTYTLPAFPQAEPSDPPKAIVKRCEDFEVTGLGDSPAWQQAEWQQLHRRPGAAHDYAARFKLLYSEQGIYVLFDGSDQRLTATFQDDFLDLWTEDVYECFFWPDEDHPIYFEYEISPLGFELPILVPNMDGKFLGWRPWHYTDARRTRKAVSATGGDNKSLATVSKWRAEVFIPFELLKPLSNVPPKSGTSWRANIYRVDYDPLESSEATAADSSLEQSVKTQWDWSRVGPSFHEYQKFGTLIFE